MSPVAKSLIMVVTSLLVTGLQVLIFWRFLKFLNKLEDEQWGKDRKKHNDF